jgi:hypothetical protein
MSNYSLFALATVAVCLSTPGQSFAQSRTDLVCWANPDQVGGCPQQYRDKVFSCGSGGHSGFNPNWVCQQTCGADQGPRCRITGGPGGDGGQCGYRAAQIECFN